MSGQRDKLRRSLGQDDGEQIQVTAQAPRPEQLGTMPLLMLSVDVYENDNESLLRADVPGGPENTVVAWDEGRGLTLLIKNQTLPTGALWASEYRPHDWYRAFTVPGHVDGMKANSNLNDRVLAIRIPKWPAVAKYIPVKTA